jgi:radical SAM protein with 4Fe4S-binding SPASM domain
MNAITPRRIVVSANDLTQEKQNCWVVAIPDAESDGPDRAFKSRLRLFEDDKPLGPGHINHDEVRRLGRGRFSHWNGRLLFSTSDNTSPLANGRRYSYEIVPEGQDVLEMPSTMHVGITTACNLTCRICRTDDPHKGSTLSDEVIERLIAEALPHLSELRLDVAGEPTLHRGKFKRLLSAATEQGVNVFMCTNAALMDEELAEFICNSSMYKIQLSADSADRERLEWVRRGLKYEELIRGIGNLVAARKAVGREGDLRFNLHAAILRDTIDDLPDLVRLAAEMGVDEVSCMFGFVHSYMEVDWSPFWDRARHNDRIDECVALGKELGVHFNYWGKFDLSADPANRPALVKSDNVCRYVHQWTYVDPSGHLAPCCISPNHSLGSLKLQGFDEVWRGPAYQDLRRTHNTDSPTNAKCASCYIMMGWDKDSYQPYFDPHHWPEVRRRLGLMAE